MVNKPFEFEFEFEFDTEAIDLILYILIDTAPGRRSNSCGTRLPDGSA